MECQHEFRVVKAGVVNHFTVELIMKCTKCLMVHVTNVIVEPTQSDLHKVLKPEKLDI